MSHRLRVTVIDMQPITPAVGGGRQRLLGLYHALGDDFDCTYVGSYDWPGESYRDQQLTRGLREIIVPLSPAHHEAAAALCAKLGGVTVIDTAFPDQADLSPEFGRVAGEHIAGADVVVFSHPWCFPRLAHLLAPDQLVVYDSHNVEALLKTEALDSIPGSAPLLRQVAGTEQALLARSSLVLACSQEDAAMYSRIFDLAPGRLRVVPNGAFTGRLAGAELWDRRANRIELGLPVGQPVAVFMGSLYGPNADAARYIAEVLAPACPDVFFLLVGGVSEALADLPMRSNLLATGVVDDSRRDSLLLSADVALNPMHAGSGTNIKMFDYMSAALPILTTEIGARGIGDIEASPDGVVIASLDEFPAKLPQLIDQLESRPELRQRVRQAVVSRFSWERISLELGRLLSLEHLRHGRRDARPKIAILSTWNISCGIGLHAGHLADAFYDAGLNVLVLGNSGSGHEMLGFERELHYAVSPTWHWDNRHWRNSHLDVSKLAQVLGLERPDALLIQQHSAFLPAFDLGEAIRVARGLGLSVVLEMHDGRNVNEAQKRDWLAQGVKLVGHHQDELAGLDAAGESLVLPLPLVAASITGDTPDPGNAPVIGGFGFLRPYKGVMMTIRVIAELRARYPGLRYRGWHAMYPGTESEEHFAACLEEASRLGIADAIEIDTAFRPTEELIASLSRTDLIMLPYEPSEEGASAAVNLALSSRRPVLVSASRIFHSVASVVEVVPQHDAKAYANAVARLLEDRERAAALVRRAGSWVDEHSYPQAARRLALVAGIPPFALKDERHE
jgi:glycosyltransferase involved in cell wall biosynthesis